MRKWPIRFLFLGTMSGCSFNFEVTSQRTALENQVLGSYQELNDDLVMSSSVRALDSSGNKKKSNVSDLQKEAVKAKQNQDFNRDDIDDLKAAQILGEAKSGELVILPKDIGWVQKADKSKMKLAEAMVREENRDREVIWQRILQSNQNLTEKDLSNVRKTYAKLQEDNAAIGHWIQSEQGTWRQKTETAENAN